MKYKRELLTALCLVVLVGVFVFGFHLGNTNKVEVFFGSVGVDIESHSIHCTVDIFKEDNLVLHYHHPGVVTDLGDNLTLAKLFGDADYNLTQYAMNATFISIGNQGSLSSSATVLPGEWNRTVGTVEDEGASTLNITATFYPTSGPHTADCIGLNIESGIGVDLSLFAYDTFSEVSGIDDTYTINVEFQVSVSHS